MINEDETGGTCGTYGVEEIHRILVDKPGGNEPLGRTRSGQADSIKVNISVSGCWCGLDE
jgi:hypothetical protein